MAKNKIQIDQEKLINRPKSKTLLIVNISNTLLFSNHFQDRPLRLEIKKNNYLLKKSHQLLN